MKTVKKILLWLLVAFVVYAIFSSPSTAADILQSAWDIIVQAAKSLGNFFHALLTHS